ncbi:hypothetical protein DMENIID0001_111930 [Sergentomyia squamirostris]
MLSAREQQAMKLGASGVHKVHTSRVTVHWDYDRSVCARTVDHRKCYWIFRDIARTSLGHHQDITRTPTVFSSV